MRLNITYNEMKHLKTYENLFDLKLEVGDWILMNDWWGGSHLRNFINSTPAQIINIRSLSDTDVIYIARFEPLDTEWVESVFGVKVWDKEFSTNRSMGLDSWVKYKYTKEEIENGPLSEYIKQLELNKDVNKYNL